MTDRPTTIVIVGAGAAGLTGAIAAAQTLTRAQIDGDVLLLDGARHIGAKILVSGGGRCNVTHDVVTPKDFFGNRNIIRNVLAAFPVERTIAWFTSLGVELKHEPTGKLFPMTDKARTVLQALIDSARRAGVTICPGHRVAAISQTDRGFLIQHNHGTTHASHVMLATGGQSLPRSGSDGFGFQLARKLGHQITPTAPALVPLVLDRSMFQATLSGLSHDVELTTLVDKREVDRRTGSLLWTHVGISGPVVLDASRFWTLATKRGAVVEMYGNFVPGQSADALRSWFVAQAAQHPRRSLVRTLSSLVPDRFAESLCRHQACESQTTVAQVPRPHRDRVLNALTHFHFPIIGDRGWNVAEVTAGGVPLEEINYRTMESKLVPGLYLLGEMLDCDGRIGGFNFQWAWTTGWLAGESVVRSLLKDTPLPHPASSLA
ncbi:putative Oxidoreductase with FAD/NAD(P)-binding domain [Candidatus Nitrospira nitrosa]|uniref:Putative Oxidoreductase with FAD/NAD(P)-binding domain n=1 Tax=Candidatus Nitrospira nitrosa TaxID=1742972 RepID=A0A0S4L6F0_9BACT|nr:NAD(P)/FAD-dependent oxidoreductase [Candidatus Nitrospira nitrosa]CUS32224.1 putative Oxidoreductase with FAD/NAD(P)-binding domain [Candidatus Nitrospira nitrosa]